MRPRRIRRGMRRRSRRLLREPGNGPTDASPWATFRFNEAPANSPGNASTASAATRDRTVASMRPRRIRRGMRSCSCDRTAPGGCFNEAPANSPGNEETRDRQPVSTASMRPRRIRRGMRIQSATLAAPTGAASMRPRRIRRGMVGKPRSWHESIRIQRFNEAPANSPGNGPEKPGPRRGRIDDGTSDGFNEAPANSPGNARSAADSRGIRRGFNEAPANSPGNAPDVLDTPTGGPGQASMRPRRIRRGMPAGIGAGGQALFPASMRPRRIRRGMRKCSSRASARGRFNEAPANSPGNEATASGIAKGDPPT